VRAELKAAKARAGAAGTGGAGSTLMDSLGKTTIGSGGTTVFGAASTSGKDQQVQQQGQEKQTEAGAGGGRSPPAGMLDSGQLSQGQVELLQHAAMAAGGGVAGLHAWGSLADVLDSQSNRSSSAGGLASTEPVTPPSQPDMGVLSGSKAGTANNSVRHKGTGSKSSVLSLGMEARQQLREQKHQPKAIAGKAGDGSQPQLSTSTGTATGVGSDPATSQKAGWHAGGGGMTGITSARAGDRAGGDAAHQGSGHVTGSPLQEQHTSATASIPASGDTGVPVHVGPRSPPWAQSHAGELGDDMWGWLLMAAGALVVGFVVYVFQSLLLRRAAPKRSSGGSSWGSGRWRGRQSGQVHASEAHASPVTHARTHLA
jgi:hypothetical protein